jgi:hypothetical protein
MMTKDARGRIFKYTLIQPYPEFLPFMPYVLRVFKGWVWISQAGYLRSI